MFIIRKEIPSGQMFAASDQTGCLKGWPTAIPRHVISQPQNVP